MAGTAAVLLIGGGLAASQDRSSKKMANEMEYQRGFAEEQAKKQERDYKREVANQEGRAEADRQTARGVARQRAIGAAGRRDTILTGPGGLTQPAQNTARRTLLGQ